MPAGNVAVDIDALPPDKVAVPRVVVPWVKVTKPVGVTPLEVTVAEKVTLEPATDGLWDEVMVVVVAAGLTTSIKVVDRLVPE